ncbi:MAG: hypothetical protein PUK40_02090 [Actinomycetaceae bacterium]|nr:hypothetical protein [Arcanobacterium sp.]MDD7504731.1 hypothetical protein [Actinomycetaceae bacterium]MDY6143094.1 hypothetical protein [Arcanobacterium sp.]
MTNDRSGVHHSRLPWDSGRFGAVYDYSSIGEFIVQRSLKDGVHRIQIPQSPKLEIYTRGLDGVRHMTGRFCSTLHDCGHGSHNYLPCTFNAATPIRDGLKGPFFSGLHSQINPYAPMVAVADPLLGHDPNLRIGWYTGLPNTGTQNIIARVLAHISSLTRKPLLCIGGSAGGFAAILYTAMLNDPESSGSRYALNSTAFVWNPQTSITDYFRSQAYLDAVFPQSHDSIGSSPRDLLTQSGIIHDLRSIPVPKRMLYIQNESDWHHLEHHAHPYIQAHGFHEQSHGFFLRTPTQVVAVADYAGGHVPLPGYKTAALIALLKNGIIPSERALKLLLGSRRTRGRVRVGNFGSSDED